MHRLAAVFQANPRLIGRYIPAPLPQRIALLQAADRISAPRGRDLAHGWRALAEDAAPYVVAGDHHSILRPPYVQAVADWRHHLLTGLA